MAPGFPQLRPLLGAPVLLASAALMALAHPQPVAAHAIHTTLESLGSLSRMSLDANKGATTAAAGVSFTLASSFSTGVPVADASVRLVPPGGIPIALGRTDARGQLNFQLPAGARSDWEVQVDGGPGHRDYLELPGLTARAVPTLPRGEIAQAGRQLGLLALIGSLGLGGLALRWRRH